MSTKNNIKTIFFDLFGVLLGIDQSVVIQYMSKLVDLPYSKTKEIMLGEIFMQLERGEIGFNTYIDSICMSIPNSGSVNKATIKSIWQDSTVGEMPAVSLLEKLFPSYKVWVISNTSENHIKQLKIKFNFLDSLDGIITSELAGISKPSPEIYHFALSSAQADPLSSLFIDDNYSNVESAKNLGFQVHHYVNYEKLFHFIGNNMNG